MKFVGPALVAVPEFAKTARPQGAALQKQSGIYRDDFESGYKTPPTTE